jgi:hypothetical protein
MTERVKGIIAFFLLLAVLYGLTYLCTGHSKHAFDPRADENSEGQCP